MDATDASHPVWVRGLKHPARAIVTCLTTSHPVWVRGLKQHKSSRIFASDGSHPVWVRGLKRHIQRSKGNEEGVAPRVGAWIETERFVSLSLNNFGRTPCGCVD